MNRFCAFMQLGCREIRPGCELSLGMLKAESDTFSPTTHHWLTFIAENVQELFPTKMYNKILEIKLKLLTWEIS